MSDRGSESSVAKRLSSADVFGLDYTPGGVPAVATEVLGRFSVSDGQMVVASVRCGLAFRAVVRLGLSTGLWRELKLCHS